MPIYEYETIPQGPGEAPKRYEIRQGMNDGALAKHPETGEPIRRIYSAFGVTGSSKGSGSQHVHSGPSCACGHGACMN